MNAPAPDHHTDHKDPFLLAVGAQIRTLRARRGLTRKALAVLADVSERHIANVESGNGNATLQFLRQLAPVLNCSLAEIIGDETASSPEWLMIRELLRGRSETEMVRAHAALGALFRTPVADDARRQRIALIGLRGAGKSTLGQKLAQARQLAFIDLSRHIETLAGCSIAEIHSLYGMNGYRRYEYQAVEDVIARFPRAVIATPGGIVSDPASFSLLLSHCHTVWLKASPEEHMARVLAQGDLRPMSGNRQAMADLNNILDSRADFYAKADAIIDTSGLQEETAAKALITHFDAISG